LTTFPIQTSLRFIPADKLEAEGYGEYAKLFKGGK